MSYQALYRAWRPDTFSEIVGQDAIVRTLRRQVESGRIAHAYLFCGTRGTGKTTAAKVLSRAINCLHPKDGDPCGECEICRTLKNETCMDVMEIDAASNNGVDEIRELRDKIKYPPTLTKYKVYIIDEVHMLSSGAFNALLKTLEEPPEHAVFILATTEPQKLPATILSRCQRFDFKRISVDTIIERLRTVLHGIGREADEDALNEIARAAEGAMRDALSLLDVCLSFTDGVVRGDLARDVLGTAGREFMFEFIDCIIAYDAHGAIAHIDTAIRRGSDPRVFALDAAAHLRGVLLAQIAGEDVQNLLEVTQEDAVRFADQAARADQNQLMRAMELFMRVESEMKYVTQPRTLLELNAVRACHPEHEADAADAERISRIEALLKNGVPRAAAAAPAPEAKPAQAPEARTEPKTAPNVPAEAPPQAYLDAVERIGRENAGAGRMMAKLTFAGLKDGVLTAEYGSREIMACRVLENAEKRALVERILSECFGAPIRFVMRQQGAKSAPVSAAAKNVIEQSYDVFGRENITLTD